MTKYYAKGEIKVVDGRAYSLESKGWVWDFYHDEDYLIKPENECSEKEALEHYVKVMGTDKGFKDAK